ncbi:MAG: hypothetical protein OJF61_002182 [Rhodanobacteraceae bacterium]|jgi:predicted nucleic acid-binding protein|nr:MAG: hypothetical protein OJF61_002182 [Rhodanobacteraceae bacterium]
MTVLVDTSVWVDHLRERQGAHVAELRALLLRPRAVATAPPILQEVLQGAKTREHFASLSQRFARIQCFAPRDAIASAIESARLYLECRLRGTTPRSSHDCLIACIAIEHGLALLHNDRDFDAIAQVEPTLRIYRYVPRGLVHE